MNKEIWIFLSLVVIVTMSAQSANGKEMKDDNIIALPAVDTKGNVPLETAISKRRSVRSFRNEDINWQQISQLLWSAQGITDRQGYRAAPSAGALYPLEIYIATKDGLYKYIPKGHKLKRLSGRDLRKSLQSAALFQSSIGEAAVDIILCAVYERVTSRYGKRGIRYTDIEVGHAAQNVHLQAVTLGLCSVPIGAFDDSAVSKTLSLPKEEVPLYIIPVGHKR